MLLYLLYIRKKTVMLYTVQSNYRPVSIMPLLTKLFERILHEKIDSHTKDILSTYQGGFRNKNSAPNIHYQQFITTNEKWKKVVDNGGSCGALLVDLSSASYCIVHDLLLAKQSAYGFDYNSLKLINSFLSGRKFKTKIGSSYNPYLDLLVGVPQVSSWFLCFLIYTSAIFFNGIMNLMSLITQTILSFIIVNQIWTLH